MQQKMSEFATKKEVSDLDRATKNSIEELHQLIDGIKSHMKNYVDGDTFDEHIADYNNIKHILINFVNNKS